jgi:hypothetical protein
MASDFRFKFSKTEFLTFFCCCWNKPFMISWMCHKSSSRSITVYSLIGCVVSIVSYGVVGHLRVCEFNFRCT